MTEQLHGAQEEVGRLRARLELGAELRELRVVALGACLGLFPRGVRDNMAEVNEHFRATPASFREAVKDGIR